VFNINKINFENGEWKVKEETIQFADEIAFTLSYYKLSSTKVNVEAGNKEASGWDVGSESSSQNQPENEEKTTSGIDFESVYLQDNSQMSSLNDDGSGEVSMQQQQQSNRLINLPPKSMADLLNKTNDFQTVSCKQAQTPLLAYWFGICKFVVLTPTRSNHFIDSESRAKVILSSISIAINNTGRLACLLRA
jgi:hypothetical protein